MPSLSVINRRLAMRYNNGTFSFNHIDTTASDENVLALGNAFASLQDEQPQRITVVITRQLL